MYRIIFCGFVIQLFTTGFFLYSASLFFPEVLFEFETDITQVMVGPTIATFVGLITMPIAGVLLDHYSARLIMSTGAICFAVGLWALAHSATIFQFVLIFGFTMALAHSLVGSMSASTIISRAFDNARGRALGLSAAGTSIGGMILPSLLSDLIQTNGWRDTLELFSAVILIITLPVIIFSTTKKHALPSSQVGNNLKSEGITNSDLSKEATIGDFLKNPGFWYLGLSLGFLFSGYSATLANLAPYIIDLGNKSQDAARLITLIAFTGLVGKLAFGLAADKFPLKSCLLLSQLLVVIAYLVLGLLPNLHLVSVACVLLGLATGGMLPIWGALMAQLFGLKNYGRANGLMAPLITICVLPGYSLMGFLYDSNGTYQAPIYVFTILLIFGMALLIPLKINLEK